MMSVRITLHHDNEVQQIDQKRTLDVSVAARVTQRAPLVWRVVRTTKGAAAMLLCCVRRATRWGAIRGCVSVILFILLFWIYKWRRFLPKAVV